MGKVQMHSAPVVSSVELIYVPSSAASSFSLSFYVFWSSSLKLSESIGFYHVCQFASSLEQRLAGG